MQKLLWVSVVVSLSSACAGGRNENDSGRARNDAAALPDAFEATDVFIPGDAGAPPDAYVAPFVDAGTDAFTAPDARMDSGPVSPCGPAGCAGWVLTRGAPTWTPIARPPGPFAPTTPVRAAFDIETLGIAYVLTDSTYHILRLSDLTYTGAGARNDLFPQSAATALINAYTIPAGHGGSDPNIESITIEGVVSAQQYGFNISTRGVAFTANIPEVTADPAWSTPDAPARSTIRAGWLALDNDANWVTSAPSSLCAGGGPRATVYASIVSTATIHTYEASGCFTFFPGSTPYTAFGPFTRPGAPRVEDVAAAFYNRGDLWILAE